MLHRSDEKGHPCLIPDIWGKAFNILLLSMLGMGLLYELDYVELYSFYTQFVKGVFIMKEC